MRIVLVVALAALIPIGASAQETEAVDPIRCWWRTTTGAVRIGETFSVVLTCAVLQNEAVQVVPDESRLDASVVQMAPFEVVSGEHPADLYAQNRRFFQYEYQLRIISPDVIGRDVRIPDPQMHYHVNSTVAENTALQGRDHTYLMPPLSVRVLSLVPADAPDIRDGTAAGFGATEQLAFRAYALRIGAFTAMALGAIVAAFAIGRVVVRNRAAKPVAARGLTPAATLRLVARTLSQVQREAAGGWTSELAGRALAAGRIAAATATGRTVHQQAGAADAGEGRLVARRWRGKATAISAAATPEDLKASGASEASQVLGDLRGALATFTRVQYGREGTLEAAALDEALARTQAAVRALRSTHAGPKAYLRRWMPQVHAAQRA